MISRQSLLSKFGVSLAAFSCLNGCGSGKIKNKTPALQEEPVTEVFVIGTRLDEDFLKNHGFTLQILPKSKSNTAILKDDLKYKIVLTPTLKLAAESKIDKLLKPSNKTQHIALDMDGSGSMEENDSKYLRVLGAKSFFGILKESKIPFLAGLFVYNEISTDALVEISKNRCASAGSPIKCIQAAKTAIPTVSGGNTTTLVGYTNDTEALQSASELAPAEYTGTPTYGSLLNILSTFDALPKSSESEKSIVLFSDGEPDNRNAKKEVCEKAKQKGIVIHAIGLGPASDISNTATDSAVEEMRSIANCTRGVYQGIRASTTSTATSEAEPKASMEKVFNNMASSITLGSMEIKVKLTGEALKDLKSGDKISGDVVIDSSGTQVQAQFEFSVPNK